MSEQLKTKCPKCKSTDLYILEIWKGHTIQWECRNGTIETNEGILEPGDPYQVEATCRKCKHIWRVRKAQQINDLFK